MAGVDMANNSDDKTAAARFLLLPVILPIPSLSPFSLSPNFLPPNPLREQKERGRVDHAQPVSLHLHTLTPVSGRGVTALMLRNFGNLSALKAQCLENKRNFLGRKLKKS
ncbi:MAG: hypothetical protein R3C51_03230 [Parvularculaceae bacterium]